MACRWLLLVFCFTACTSSHTPTDGGLLARVTQVTPEEYGQVAARAHQAFLSWRELPAPKRGEVVRQLGNALRELKEAAKQADA